MTPEKLLNTNNNINDYKRATVANGHVLCNVESNSDAMLESETEESQGEHIPFLKTDMTTALLLRASDSARTNPASPNTDNLQVLLCSATIKDPVAV